MARIGGIEITEGIMRELTRRIESIDPGELEIHAAGFPDITRGLRGAKAGGRVKGHLVWLLSTERDLSEPVVSILRENSLYQDFLCVLSEKAIEAGLDLFAGIFGHDALACGLILDEREAMRAIGAGIARGSRRLSPPREPLSGIRELFSPFLGIVSDWAEGLTGPASRRIAELEEKIVRLDKEKSRSVPSDAASPKRLKRLVKELSAARSKAEKLNEDLERARARIGEERRKREDLERKLGIMVERRLAAEMERRLSGYLSPPGRYKGRSAALVEILSARIEAEETLDGSDFIERFALDAARLGLLDEPGLARIRYHLRRTKERIYDPYAPARTDERKSGRSILERADLVLIDGYNVAFQGEAPEGADLDRIRDELVRFTSGLAKAHPEIEWRIYFDGVKPGIEERMKNLFIVFTDRRHGERDNADNEILEYLDYLGKGDRKVCVVSNDLDLRGFAAERGASLMGIGEFRRLR